MEELIPTDLLEEYKQAFQILDRKNVGKISIRVSLLDHSSNIFVNVFLI